MLVRIWFPKQSNWLGVYGYKSNTKYYTCSREKLRGNEILHFETESQNLDLTAQDLKPSIQEAEARGIACEVNDRLAYIVRVSLFPKRVGNSLKNEWMNAENLVLSKQTIQECHLHWKRIINNLTLWFSSQH